MFKAALPLLDTIIMIWNVAIISFLGVFLTCVLLAVYRKPTKLSLERPIENYLLAGSQLRRRAVVNLLLSVSFGLNPLFFQIWLGYLVGAWALVIQGAWAIGFVLLSPYSNTIAISKSLHEKLGMHFRSTRIIAALFSLLGIMFMICWESKVGVTVFQDIFKTSSELLPIKVNLFSNVLVWAIIIGTLFYTIIGGLRGNANADIVLNISKIVLVLLMIILIFISIQASSYRIIVDKFFPSLENMSSTLGWWGLITNVVFSLVWQFVDNSTWQGLIAGRDQEKNRITKTLTWSGVMAFIAPGIIGTILGVCLSLSINVTTNSIFSEIINLIPNYREVGVVLIFIITISCMMSMLDGLFLTSAYTLVIDIMHSDKTLSDLDSDTDVANQELVKVRIILIAIALVSVGAIRFFMDFLEVNIFDYIYFMIISQLALFGPTILTLSSKRIVKHNLAWAMAGAALIGFISAIVGAKFNINWLKDGAGTFTIISSCVLALVSTGKSIIKKNISYVH